ncbi:MAG: hypothetical protein K6U04_08675 [Armatimonadetes bacterium]|nr:hypothetical protein [Armatimonadota bacterium]
MNELILLESRSLRDEVVVKTGVLEKVKFLRLLPDNQHATTEMVANFYKVSDDTVRKTVKRHKDELLQDGLRTISRKELRDMLSLSSRKLTESGYVGQNARSVTLFPYCAILLNSAI